MILTGVQQHQGTGLLCNDACRAGHFFERRIFGAGIKNDAARLKREDRLVKFFLLYRIQVKCNRIDFPLRRQFGYDRNIEDLSGFFSHRIHRALSFS